MELVILVLFIAMAIHALLEFIEIEWGSLRIRRVKDPSRHIRGTIEFIVLALLAMHSLGLI